MFSQIEYSYLSKHNFHPLFGENDNSKSPDHFKNKPLLLAGLMQISVTDTELNSFSLLPTDYTLTRTCPSPMCKARLLVLVEVLLSLCFHIAMLVSARRGHWMNLAMAVIVAVNMLAAGRLLMRLHGQDCASPITVYIVWKILQEVILVPVLVVFTFIMMEGYIKSWSSPRTAIQVLIVVWIYALYSFFLILYLCGLARLLWQRKEAKRRNSYNSAISFITRSFDTADGESQRLSPSASA